MTSGPADTGAITRTPGTETAVLAGAWAMVGMAFAVGERVSPPWIARTLSVGER